MINLNLVAYTDALKRAEERSAKLGTASVIKYWDHDGSFSDLNFGIDWMDMTGCRIVASVDHTGIITESRWVKQQMGVAA